MDETRETLPSTHQGFSVSSGAATVVHPTNVRFHASPSEHDAQDVRDSRRALADPAPRAKLRDVLAKNRNRP